MEVLEFILRYIHDNVGGALLVKVEIETENLIITKSKDEVEAPASPSKKIKKSKSLTEIKKQVYVTIISMGKNDSPLTDTKYHEIKEEIVDLKKQ